MAFFFLYILDDKVYLKKDNAIGKYNERTDENDEPLKVQ